MAPAVEDRRLPLSPLPRSLRCAFAPLAMLALIGSACALKTPPDAAAIKAQGMAAVKVPPAWAAPGAGPGSASENWLRAFGDEQLVAAVKEAIAYNADLQAGAARAIKILRDEMERTFGYVGARSVSEIGPHIFAHHPGAAAPATAAPDAPALRVASS